ncbi:hypothetical protein Poli38472_013368 [Pythium oligandrum]|uniref:AAA+ ATPase domain-containing protein n=1 Tax=Pythium oligandrum TaxID=41045 RepID=A0A8K1C776_PYTOL|nr:hypothetical protein Poli38472_013368 [Pythium oligandrum]|eukprot:TMW57894.1 hypothetical protein Poli38472_013368 [Pythium oligandrum]
MSSTAIEFGLINTLRTNHVLVDAFLCMLVPLLIQRVMNAVQTSQTSLWTLICNIVLRRDDTAYVNRVIEFTQKFNRYGTVWDNEQQNDVLQKAVSIYLSEMIDLRNKTARCELIEKPKKKAKTLDDDNDDTHSMTSMSSTEDEEDNRCEVEKLNVEELPPFQEWIEVADGVEFMHEVVSSGETDDKLTVKESKVVFRFRSAREDGATRIDELVQNAFAAYRAKERAKHKSDKSRYFYIQNGGSDSMASSNAVVTYKRYALSEEKTFDNLFFDEKTNVMQLLDHFMKKTGKFAIRGFPYKLGFLLHGPPGTGKTSLIKAIAQHTKRHIVTINLSKIRTNQELLDAVFDLKFTVEGMDYPVPLTFEDVVFVMEDIDAASRVVQTREEKPTFVRSESSVERMVESQKKAKQIDDAEKAGDEELMPSLMGPALKPKETDKLNLSGLLNVLDGVIDCPGRIVIMTTNHPEKLDPALIRPGRVNKMLLLTHMNATQCQHMIEYYCMEKLTEKQSERLQAIYNVASRTFTPAEIEEYCAEHDDADSILDAIEAHADVAADAF